MHSDQHSGAVTHLIDGGRGVIEAVAVLQEVREREERLALQEQLRDDAAKRKDVHRGRERRVAVGGGLGGLEETLHAGRGGGMSAGRV